MRRLLSLGLSLVMMVGFVPTAALADESEGTLTPTTPQATLAPADLDDTASTDEGATVATQSLTEISDETAMPAAADDGAGQPLEPAPGEATVKATLSADEKVVTVTAAGGDFASAKDVTFNTWASADGKDKAIAHGALRHPDGTWTAKIFIAADTPTSEGIPYNGQLPNAVHRLYNPYSGEHLYTADNVEADTLARAGWNYESVAWVTPNVDEAADTPAGDPESETTEPNNDNPTVEAPETDTDQPREEGATPGDDEPAPPSAQPIYRLFNAGNGEHLYTSDYNEYATLPGYGWKQEGVKLYSDPAEGVPIYRLQNPSDPNGAHLYTVDYNEYTTLSTLGWNPENIVFYGAAINDDASWSKTGWAKPHSAAGDYTIEAYAELEAADPPADDEVSAQATTSSQLLGTASFTVSAPTGQISSGTIDNAHGTFEVVVSAIASPSGVAKVYIPTWSAAKNQSDIKWYEATRQSDGSWKATVSAADHGLERSYVSHAYVQCGNGVMSAVGSLTTELTLANYINIGGGPYRYWIGLYNPGAVSQVTIGAWSQENGADDAYWSYANDQGDGWWSVTLDTINFRSAGTIQVDAYADGDFRNSLVFTISPDELIELKYRQMNEKINNLASPTNYLIAVDTARCFVGIYTGSRGQWKNLTWWPCSPGAPWTPTVKGLFSVGSRGYSFGSGYTCYYWTQFFGDYLFHSIKYNEGTFTVQDGTMGAQVSHGCVRLWLDNARWIYNNIPSGTTVLTY